MVILIEALAIERQFQFRPPFVDFDKFALRLLPTIHPVFGFTNTIEFI